jgi:hypothetical protein
MGAQIPVITEKPLTVCGCRKFKIDSLGDHLCTCTTHSDAKKVHDWAVDQLGDLFRTTHRVKTQQVVKNRGQHCGDIELVGYLVNGAGPVPLVLDLNENANDKIRKYRTDYNNNPRNVVAFMVPIAGTNGRLHSDFITFLFLQAHQETDRFFADSGVH